MIHVHIVDAQCITLLLCEFPAQFFALVLCHSGPVPSAALGGFSTAPNSGTSEALTEINSAELSAAGDESFP